MVQKMAFAVGALDATIRRSMDTIHQHKIGGQAPLAPPDLGTAAATALNTLDDDGTLYVDGHAAAPEVLGVPRAAVSFGGLTVEALADLITRKGLLGSFTGKIYLNGCNTANADGMSYAHRFQIALSLRGVRCIVKGNAGYSQVVPATGHTLVVPSTAHGAHERAALQQLNQEAERLHVEIDRLATYLRDNRQAADWNAKSGDFTLRSGEAMALRGTMTAQHARTYLADKALRPTLPAPAAITHYEHQPHSYAALPAAIGLSGRTLARHARDALATYDKKWKFNPSAASTAAVLVITGVLANFPALLMAIRWYTGLGPKPPLQLVATGAALSNTSSLYLMLLRQFVYWQSGNAPQD